MITVIVALAVFSIIILMHEAGHLMVAKKCGVKVETFSLGFGKRLCGISRGGTDYRISMLPFGGYVKMAGEDPSELTGEKDELLSKPSGKRFWIFASGSMMNYIFAYILFSAIFMMGVPVLSNTVGQVLPDYPAVKAGIEVGDEIVSINGQKVEYWEDLVALIQKEYVKDPVLDCLVIRNGRSMHIGVKPDISEATNIFGQTFSRPMIGIAPTNEMLSVSYGPFQAMYQGGKRLLILTAVTYKGIWLLVTGGMPVATSMSGPIGIARLMGQAVHVGFVQLLFLMAQISMALAIFNLLPFPVLDGGHIIFLGLEKFRGRPLSVKVQEIIANIAIVMLISLMLFVSWNDIQKLPFFNR